MTGADPLSEALRILGKLVAAAAAPARRDAALLRDDAPRIRQQLEAAKAAGATTKEPIWLAWLDWLPWVGDQFRPRPDRAEDKLAEAKREWQSVRTRAQEAADVLNGVAEAQTRLKRMRRALDRGLQIPPEAGKQAEMLLARVKFLAATDGKDARRAPQLAVRCFALVQEAEALIRPKRAMVPVASHAAYVAASRDKPPTPATAPAPPRPAPPSLPPQATARMPEPPAKRVEADNENASPPAPAVPVVIVPVPETAAVPAADPAVVKPDVVAKPELGSTTIWRDASNRITPFANRSRRRVQPADQLSLNLGPVAAAEPVAAKTVEPLNPPQVMGRRAAPAPQAEVEAEPRIWLPVSPSRMHEVMERGARLDRSAPRRGSQLWIPVSERHAVESFLPLAFRTNPTRFSFPPIRHGASGQNLWSVFDRDNWNHIRTTCYDRAGHRCQICGKQGGGLWSRITPEEERAKRGVVDCHEVWEWEVTDPVAGTGVQRLQRMFCLCKDCHAIFHEGFTLSKARAVGIEAEAADYIRARRMLVNRCDGAGLDMQLAEDSRAWAETSKVGHWVLDLSHLAAQDYMADRVLTLCEGNSAEIGPGQVGGIAFRTEDGTAYAATDARALASGAQAQPLAVSAGLRR